MDNFKKDLQIIAGSFLSRQVCVPKEMPIALATYLLNEKDTCGTSLGWIHAEELGEVVCDNDSTRKHLCFDC